MATPLGSLEIRQVRLRHLPCENIKGRHRIAPELEMLSAKKTCLADRRRNRDADQWDRSNFGRSGLFKFTDKGKKDAIRDFSSYDTGVNYPAHSGYIQTFPIMNTTKEKFIEHITWLHNEEFLQPANGTAAIIIHYSVYEPSSEAIVTVKVAIEFFSRWPSRPSSRRTQPRMAFPGRSLQQKYHYSSTFAFFR